jgi:hypothetical protein
VTAVLTPPVTELDRAIRSAIHDVVAGRVALDAFESWFVKATWGAVNPGTETAALVYGVELRLAEYDLGHLTLDDFLREMRALADTFRFTPTSITSTATRRTPVSVALQR